MNTENKLIAFTALYVTLVAILFLGVVSISTLVGINYLAYGHGLLSGFVIMLIALLVHKLGRKIKVLYYGSIILNAIVFGLSISSFYVLKGVALDYATLIKGLLLPLMLLMWGNFVFGLPIDDTAKKCNLFVAYFVTVVCLVVAFLRLHIDTSFYSYMCFMLICNLFLFAFQIIDSSEKSFIQNISRICFGLYSVVGVLFLLTLAAIVWLNNFTYGGGSDSCSATEVSNSNKIKNRRK